MPLSLENLKQLQLQITGTTSKETIRNTVWFDITDPETWNLIYHRFEWKINGPLGTLSPSETISVVHSAPSVFQHKTNQRILKEGARFASKDENAARMLRILSLKQTEAWIKNPLTFKKLVVSSPLDVKVPEWYQYDANFRNLLKSRLTEIQF